MDRAARTEGLDQGAILPEGTLHVGAGRPGDSPPDGELGGADDLGMRTAHHAGDVRGLTSLAGSVKAWRAIRRAVTPVQVRCVGLVSMDPYGVSCSDQRSTSSCAMTSGSI